MCGRYLFYDDKDDEEIRKIVKQIKINESIQKTGEIFPTDNVPIIIRHINYFKMGLSIAKQKLIINARIESISEKPLFMNSFINGKRCLIPANSF